MSCFLTNREKEDLRFTCLHYTYTSEVYSKQDLIRMAGQIERWHSNKKKRPWVTAWKTDGKYGYRYILYHALVGHGVAMLVQDPRFSRAAASDCCAGVNSTNRYGLQVAMVTNFDTEGDKSEKLLATLVAVIGDLEKNYAGNTTLTVHREQAKKCKSGTLCPGERFYRWYINGGRQQLVNWVNEYKSTGKLPFGYKVKFDGQFWELYEEEAKPCKELEEELENLKHENSVLEQSLKRFMDKYTAQKRENNLLEYLISDLNAKIKMLEDENESLRRTLPWCEKLKILISDLLDAVFKFLRNKFSKVRDGVKS